MACFGSYMGIKSIIVVMLRVSFCSDTTCAIKLEARRLTAGTLINSVSPNYINNHVLL